MKSFFVKMALEEHGHLVILALFDSVDDTKFVAKAVIEVSNLALLKIRAEP